ncbi:MAG: TIGR02206 family membrane protein [Eubacteriales bacterium]|nr:TIGR02206 family membrane protein [Eubacteriales bacterium]
MFQYFWLHKSDLPPHVGTPNFSPTHLTWLATVFILIVAILFWYRRQSTPVRYRARLIIAVLLMAGDLIRWTWAGIIGHYNVQEMLPLHLCTVSVIIEVTSVFSTKKLFKEFAYAIGMPGALAALLTPDWGVYPFLSFQYLQSVTTHSLLVLLPVLWIWGEGFRPNARELPRTFGLLAGLSVIAATANYFLGSNYMFLREAPKDTPLEIFETWFGNPGYIVPLVGLVLVIWFVFYTPWAVIAHFKKAVAEKAPRLPDADEA